MTERLSDVNARITSARQISSVVSATRAIAAARMRDARLRLDSVRRYSQSVGEAISRTLPLASQAAGERPSQAGRRLVVAIGAEQGFAGGFSERVLRVVAAAKPDDLMLIGDRAIGLAQQLGLRTAWSALSAAHLDQIEAVAERIAEEIWSRVAQGSCVCRSSTQRRTEPAKSYRARWRRSASADLPTPATRHRR
jgi:F-type H+-transporting ATPase subunit gamma